MTLDKPFSDHLHSQGYPIPLHVMPSYLSTWPSVGLQGVVRLVDTP